MENQVREELKTHEISHARHVARVTIIDIVDAEIKHTVLKFFSISSN